LHVLVHHHIDGSYSVWKGLHLLGRFDSSGSILEQLRKKQLDRMNCRWFKGISP
jgi:hypothetical protein